MTTERFILHHVHPSWQDLIENGLKKMNADYLQKLAHSSNWLPGLQNIFNAFSLPLENVNFVLFGESPYPRKISANGYAFWDANVTDLWSESGLSKQVNRATSLRNMIKMLLVAKGKLSPKDTSQQAIANVDKTDLVQTNNELFNNLLNHGFLLLNTSLVLQEQSPTKDARQWLPFIQLLIKQLLSSKPDIHYILLGRIANMINPMLPPDDRHKLTAEHPYNITFITNNKVLSFFKPLDLLSTAK